MILEFTEVLSFMENIVFVLDKLSIKIIFKLRLSSLIRNIFSVQNFCSQSEFSKLWVSIGSFSNFYSHSELCEHLTQL